MLQRPAICNGEKNGTKCKHYFSFAARTDAQNPEFLNLGMKFRNCTVCPGWLIEWEGWEDLPHHCDRYVPDYKGLRWLVWRIGQFFSFGRKVDKSFEDYTPMTQEAVTELTKRAHDKERARVKALHDPANNKSTDLFDATAKFASGGIPGQTTMATPEMLKEQVKNIAVVKDGVKTIDEVLAEMNFDQYEPLTQIEKKPKTKAAAKKNPKVQKLQESVKDSNSDGGIFADGENHE